MRFSLILVGVFSILSGYVRAQSDGATALTQNKYSQPVLQYKEATIISQNLYNGRVYYIYDSRQEEHQFFESRKWTKGSLLYDGQEFDSVAMLYDIVRDEVVIRHFNGDNLLLQSAKIGNFSLMGHHYERLTSASEIEPWMKSGFYELLHGGETKALIRRTKQRQEKIVDKRVITLFPPKDFFYIKKDGHYQSVYSKRAVFGLFPEEKKAMRRLLRDQNIKFRKDRENAIAKMVALHDQLAKK